MDNFCDLLFWSHFLYFQCFVLAWVPRRDYGCNMVGYSSRWGVSWGLAVWYRWPCPLSVQVVRVTKALVFASEHRWSPGSDLERQEPLTRASVSWNLPLCYQFFSETFSQELLTEIWANSPRYIAISICLYDHAFKVRRWRKLSHSCFIARWLLDAGFLSVYQGTCGSLPNAAVTNSFSEECKPLLEWRLAVCSNGAIWWSIAHSGSRQGWQQSK
jgi:hypothetical protein